VAGLCDDSVGTVSWGAVSRARSREACQCVLARRVSVVFDGYRQGSETGQGTGFPAFAAPFLRTAFIKWHTSVSFIFCAEKERIIIQERIPYGTVLYFLYSLHLKKIDVFYFDQLYLTARLI
jgi:hypothetical protein